MTYSDMTASEQQSYTALLNQFRLLPQEIHSEFVKGVAATPDMPPAELAQLMQFKINEYAALTGNDGLVAAPNSMELMTEVGMLGHQYENGLTTTNSADVERMTFAVKATVKQMIASGASDADIQQAVGNLPGVTPELASVAQQVAQQQLDAEKFALIDTRNQEVPQQGAPALSLAAIFDAPMMALAAPNEAPASEQAATANPFAALIAGIEISRELRTLNPSAEATKADPSNIGQFETQLSSRTQQRPDDSLTLQA